MNSKAPFDASTIVDAAELAEWLRLEDHEVMAFARAGLFPRTPDGRSFPLVRAIKNFIRLQEARSSGEPFPSRPA